MTSAALIALGVASGLALLWIGYLLGWVACEAQWERMGWRKRR